MKNATTSPPLATEPSIAATTRPISAPVTQRTVTRAEWIKFTSVRSNIVGLAGAGLTLICFGVLFAAIAGTDDSGPPRAGSGDSLSAIFGGMTLSQLVISIMAAVFASGEHAAGLLRTMFMVVPRRVPVLRAKAIVVGGANWAVMTIASFLVFFAGTAAYSGDGRTFSLIDDGVIRAILGGGVYGGGVAVFGLALGFLLRSTASSIGLMVGLFFLGPVLVRLIPGAVGDTVTKLLPSNAGSAFMSVTASDDLLSPEVGSAVFIAWVLLALIAAAVTTRRRDA